MCIAPDETWYRINLLSLIRGINFEEWIPYVLWQHLLCFLESGRNIFGSAELVIYHGTLNFTVMCNCAAGTSGIFKRTVGILNNALLLKLKGLTGIIRSLPLTLPHSEACMSPARIHWACLVFSPWFNASCSLLLLIYFMGPSSESVASRTVISLPVEEQKSDL